tara:strand:- start:18 stop:617 length:600 start_codon:yes stop_codon:yes gene_type:complete
MKIKKIKVFRFVIVSVILILIGSCGQVIIGGATTAGLSVVQERSSKQAAIDILIKTKIEEAMFSNSYEKLFSKVRVIVYEGRVLLVGTVEKKETKTEAENIAWSTKNVKEVGNYISLGKNDLVDYVKDTRISLEFRAKLLTDKEVSEVNFSSTTENRILYIVGIAQDQEEIKRVLNHASNIAGITKIINLIKEKNDPER